MRRFRAPGTHLEAFEPHSGADCCFDAPRTRLQRTVEQVAASGGQGHIPNAQWSSLSPPCHKNAFSTQWSSLSSPCHRLKMISLRISLPAVALCLHRLRSTFNLFILRDGFTSCLRIRCLAYSAVDSFYCFARFLLWNRKPLCAFAVFSLLPVARRTAHTPDTKRETCHWICLFVGVFFANSSCELNMPQPGGHVTTRSLIVVHVDSR